MAGVTGEAGTVGAISAAADDEMPVPSEEGDGEGALKGPAILRRYTSRSGRCVSNAFEV